ncbi:MAG: hypothetical protein ACOCZ7_04680, partial [Armatimonadota bacterium]
MSAKLGSLMLVSALLALALTGCGGSDGGNGDNGGPQPPPPKDWTLQEAMVLQEASAPDEPSQANQDALEEWEDESNLPETPAELQDALNRWANAVEADRNDPAAQMGLMMVILAMSSQNAAQSLGYDLFDEVVIREAATFAFDEELDVAKFVGDALDVSALAGVPRIRGANAPQVNTADTTPEDLQDYREAAVNHLLPAVEDAVERCTAIADNCDDSATSLLEYEADGERFAMYASEFNALAGGMELIRCGLLMVTAVNPDYGGYNWDLDLDERDANGDGVLTVAEY